MNYFLFYIALYTLYIQVVVPNPAPKQFYLITLIVNCYYPPSRGYEITYYVHVSSVLTRRNYICVTIATVSKYTIYTDLILFHVFLRVPQLDTITTINDDDDATVLT